MEVPTVPFLSKHEFAAVVDKFLGAHHPDGTIPVPIEWIIDYELDFHIVSLPSLKQGYGIDGYLSHHCRTVWVDRNTYDNSPGRLRYTLAHEIGHYELHRDIYESNEFSDLAEYMTFHEMLKDNPIVHEQLDLQADIFSSMLLMPEGPLRDHVSETLGSNRAAQLDVTNKDLMLRFVARELAPIYEVSKIAMYWRLFNGDFV